MRRIQIFWLTLLLTGCLSKSYYVPVSISSEVVEEMKFADAIAELINRSHYTQAVRSLKEKYMGTPDGNLGRLYINLEITEIYLYKLKDYSNAERHLQKALAQLTLLNQFASSKYVDLPAYSSNYKAKYFNEYYKYYRNIGIGEVEDRLNTAHKNIKRLISKNVHTTPLKKQKLINKKQKIK